MKVVLAGGSGLLGRHLVTALVAERHFPVVLSRDPACAARRLPRGALVRRWDPGGDPIAWAGELGGADVVVNLAGESVGTWPWTERRKRLLRESRLRPTSALVAALGELAPDRRPRVLVSASGTDLYEGRDDEPATEESPAADTFLARLCQEWEAAALQAEPLGLRVVTLRTSLVVAPGAPALERLVLPFRLFLGGPIGSGEQWFSWVDVEDAVGLVLRAMHDPGLSGPLNVAAPDPRRQRDVARALGAVLGRPSRIRTPAWLVRLVLAEQATLLLGSRRVWPDTALRAGYRFRRPRLEDSLAAALAASRLSSQPA